MRDSNTIFTMILLAVLVLGIGIPVDVFARSSEDVNTSGVAKIEEPVGDVETKNDQSRTLSHTNPINLIYENSNENPGNTGFFVHQNSVAQDFVLSSPATVSNVNFILIEYQGSAFDNVIQYAILGGESAPNPNEVITSGDAQNLQGSELSTLSFGKRVAVSYDLETPVQLDANKRYWLWMHTGTGVSGTSNDLWEVSSSTVGECTRFYPSSDTFTTNPTSNCSLDTWFQLTNDGTEPEPTSDGLYGSDNSGNIFEINQN